MVVDARRLACRLDRLHCVGPMLLALLLAVSNTFVHPGIIVSRPLLERIRAAVLRKDEPTWSAFIAVNMSRTYAGGEQDGMQFGDLAYKPHPQPITLSHGWIKNKEDAFAAYTHALLWFVTRDCRHAGKAIEIMARTRSEPMLTLKCSHRR